MSAPHRGLPPPAAMTLAQPPPPPPPQPHGPPHPPHPQAMGSVMQSQVPPAPSPHGQTRGSLPPPPSQWQGSEDTMKNWLMARSEEERTRQEEERTRQESLRLEQRRLEHEILRTSLERGIPPPMIPVLFAGLGSSHFSPATMEWLQQFLPSPHHAPILQPHGPMSPGHRRDSQQYGSYAGSAGVPPTPGSAAGTQAGFVQYQGPGSPARARAHTIGSLGGAANRPVGGLGTSALPRLTTGEGIAGPPHTSHTTIQQHQQPSQPPAQQQQQQGAATQQETQSPGIYFHYWQPPTSNAGSSQQAASSDSPKKRKATGPQPSVPPPSQRRSRSPTFVQQGGTALLSHPPPGRRRGHSRQRSDISAYRSKAEVFGPHGGFSPGMGAPLVGTSRENTFAEPYQQSRSSHSVSSMLSSDQPSSRFPPDGRSSGQQLEREQRSRAGSEERGERGRGAHPPPPPPPPPPPAPRERTNE
ncbi:hypothetical protein F4808DRAFT_232505 [Astrocystis sublimbata]|nr:hypothetical protein F4808DRAFT_232505 [Astrocystis sublimbata]